MNNKKSSENIDFSYSIENIHLHEKSHLIIFDYGVSEDNITKLHCHNTLELGVCKKGNGIFIIGNKVFNYKVGDISIITPGIYHRAHANDPKEDLWTFCYLKLEDWINKSFEHSFGFIVSKFEDYEINTITKMLFKELEIADIEYKNELISCLLKLIYLFLKKDNEVNSFCKNNIQDLTLDLRIKKAIEIMSNKDFYNYSIPKIANECCLSESYFRHLFIKQIGVSPKTYQTELKLKKAMSIILYKNDTIMNIAYECGFESLSNFNRCFKSNVGKSPLKWKQEQLYN
jgi:AraC-like DNA-binding protein/quercetin dioxygenase-like cupin family protein